MLHTTREQSGLVETRFLDKRRNSEGTCISLLSTCNSLVSVRSGSTQSPYQRPLPDIPKFISPPPYPPPPPPQDASPHTYHQDIRHRRRPPPVPPYGRKKTYRRKFCDKLSTVILRKKVLVVSNIFLLVLVVLSICMLTLMYTRCEWWCQGCKKS